LKANGFIRTSREKPQGKEPGKLKEKVRNEKILFGLLRREKAV